MVKKNKEETVVINWFRLVGSTIGFIIGAIIIVWFAYKLNT